MRPLADDPKMIFAYGESYRLAGDHLRSAQTAWRFTFPTLVCIAFATELYFKALIAIEKGKAPHGHDLSNLFRQVSKNRQLRVRQLFNEQTKAPAIMESRKNHAAFMEARGIALKPLTFDAALEASAKGFEQLRYGYELRPGFEWMGAHICNAIVGVILEIHPDWLNHTPGPPEVVKMPPE